MNPEPAVERLLTDAARETRLRLSGLPRVARHTAFVSYAASAADRLFAWYDQTPTDQRHRYSETWRPVLENAWDYLAGDDDAFTAISHALGEFFLSPYNHNSGQDGPDDADQDEVAATYFVASCVMHGLVDFAILAAARATDHLDTMWAGVDDGEWERSIVAEIDRQRRSIDVIVTAAESGRLTRSAPADLIDALRRPT